MAVRAVWRGEALRADGFLEGTTMATLLTISKRSTGFEVDDLRRRGLPPVGRGRTMASAIGNYILNNQHTLGIEFIVDSTAQPAELRRRRRELAKR
jgi:hypothetical protein